MRVIYLLMLILFLGCQDQKIDKLNTIANDLLLAEKKTSSGRIKVNDVVKIGNSLNEILKNRKTPISSIKIEIQRGDFLEDGKKKVTHSILYTSTKSKLGLRMRYDKEIDKFHIVGYSGMIE